MSIDFVKGTVLLTSGKTLMSSDFELFSELTNWPNYGLKDAPEILIQMVSVGLLNRTLPLEEKLVAVVGHHWDYHASVSVDDTLYVSCKITDLVETKKPGRAIVTLSIETKNHSSKVVASGEWKILVTL